jgi:hypothetical protein
VMKNLVLMSVFALGMGCSEYSYTSKIQKDVFQQVRRNTVDILLVIDDSCSMLEEQEKLSTNFEYFISAFAGVDVDWQIGVTTTDTYYVEQPGKLLGGDDELILMTLDDRILNAVQWDETWPYEEGVAMQLSGNSYSATSNTSKGNWCLASDSFGDGDLGTPNEDNPDCDGGTVEDRTGEISDADPVPPNMGDLIFTEALLDAKAVSDTQGEWVELSNLKGHTLDLTGISIRDNGKNMYAFPEGTTIAPYQTIVVGRAESENGGITPDFIAEEGLTLNNKTRVLTSQMEDAQEIFEEMVVVGISGSGIEMGLEAAHLALSEPLISNENSGFIRDSANLSLIFISDEDDLSPMSTPDYLQFFTDIKGDAAYRDHSMMNISAVVGKDRPPYEGEASCSSDSGVGYYGPRYIELASKTEGSLESICDDDFSEIALELGLTASGLKLNFILSSLADASSLKVALYAEESDDSLIAELVQGEDYTYDADENAIVFAIESLPASETYILAEYRVLATGSVVTESVE